MKTTHKAGRPGGNFTQAEVDLTGYHDTVFRVYVARQLQPEKYETEMEAANALRAATRRPVFECVIDESAGLAGVSEQ